MHKDLDEILRAGLEAADPEAAVRRALTVEGDRVTSGGESFPAGRVFVLAVGKAAGPMAKAAEELLGDRVAGGIVVAKEGYELPPLGLETLSAAHPEPDEGSVAAARRVTELAASLGEGDLLLALVSGGASSLLADPVPPVELAEIKELTGALLRSGAEIGEINAVRKHVSVLKGGGLVRQAAPARTLALLLSDVVGDHPSSIGSGLTAPDPTTSKDAWEVLARYGIEPPQRVAEHLAGEEEAPKPGDALFEEVTNVVCGGGRQSAERAAERAGELGYRPLLLSTSITGEAQGIASVYAAMVREVLETGNPAPPPCALVSGGEATVSVQGDGIGGPNQEFALTLAQELDGVEGWAAFAADTDGNDGPTDAAGGLVDGATAGAARKGGVDLRAALARNESYRALQAAGALLVTGPTGTNVNDLRVALVE